MSPGDISIGTNQPNILVIMVDQLRYKELAQNNLANSYPLEGILPNITALQKQSAEFQNYFTVGRSCTPARAAKLTGLYSPQTCMYVTQGNDAAPNLLPTFASGGTVTGFPTFASFLQSLAGLNATYGTSFKSYNCAWFGKWHLSDETENDNTGGLQKYGFSEKIIPSPNGNPNEGINGQTGSQDGDGSATYDSDLDIFNYFVQQMPQFIGATLPPWLAVVSLINPHDISNYPQYMLNYCDVASLPSPIEPNFPPLLPGSLIPVGPAQLVPVSQFPPLPAVYNSASTASNTGSDCSAYTGFLPASAVTTSALGPVPSNTTDNLADKPPLQQIYQNDIGSATQAGKPNTGDVGSFLNVYYWLTSCIDRLIGSPLPVSGVYSDTILGRLASMMNEAGLDLTNTVIIFTSDHGEYGGAHGLYGKGGANYDEAINVPLFVQIPGVSGNYPRPQLCSSVDFFGLIAALATNNFTPTGSTIPIWMGSSVNPQLAAREQLYTFLESASTPNARVLPGGFPGVGGMPYVLQTTDEFWIDEAGAYDYAFDSGEAYHVIGLRTANYKLSTYTAWGINQSTPGTINFANIPTAEIEFYNYATNPTEVANDYSSYLSTHPTFMAALENAFSIVATSELQAPLSTTFPSTTYSLSNSQQTAAASYNLYIDPPASVSLSVTSFAVGVATQVTITGSNIQPGPIVKTKGPGLTESQRIQTPVGSMSPIAVTLTFTATGNATVTLLNPSLAPCTPIPVTVS